MPPLTPLVWRCQKTGGRINVCIGGTAAVRKYSEEIIPREPREDDAAYARRIYHATLPPFLQRLASQAAGTILRKGIHLEGGDEDYWNEWRKDVTGDGTPLNEFARRLLVDALLFGHTSMVVDFPNEDAPRTLREEVLATGRKPYLCLVNSQQVRGWRTANTKAQGELTQVRYMERVVEPEGEFGEDVIDQVRVLTPGGYQVWRYESETNRENGWTLHESGKTSLDEIPFVTVYSNRVGTLMSKPPLLEVANLCISYCQRFADYHHSIHVGAQPILVLKGFDPENDSELGMSVNTAVLLPPDGDAMYVEPTSAVYESQLRLLQTLEEQISSLGISALAKQNITNTAAESKRLDRIDSDSIMAIISQDLAGAMTDMLRIAGKYAGKEPPMVTIPKDFENRLLDGNQITAMLQLQMQNQISQETLLRILAEGEILPPYVEIDEEILRTRDAMEEEQRNELEMEAARIEVAQEAMPDEENEGGVTSGNAASGGSSGNNTLPTPMRPGKHAD